MTGRLRRRAIVAIRRRRIPVNWSRRGVECATVAQFGG